MKKFIIIAFIALNLYNSAIAQMTERKGNLLRIDFTKPEINLSDTLWSWFDKREMYDWNSDYSKRVVNRNGVEYIFGNVSKSNDYFSSGNSESYYFYNSRTQTKKTYFGHGVPIDIVSEPYISIYDKLYFVDNGMWLLFGVTGNCFIDSGDSVHSFSYYSNNKPAFTDIIGKVNNNFLVAVKRDDSAYPPSYDYHIANLSNSPSVEFISTVKLNYEHDYYQLPEKISQLKDSLYLMNKESSSGLFLAELSDTSFTLLKELEYNSVGNWFLENNVIYYADYLNEMQLVKEEFDFSSQSFTNKVILYSNIKGNFYYDNQYLVMLTADSLIVFDYKQKKLIDSYDVSNIKHLDSCILNPPYIYVHVIDKTVGVEENEKPTEFFLSQNYPNPFNPETTIEYTIPNVETLQATSLHVTLKVYDILGREIATLVNEHQHPGKYSVHFNVAQISNLPGNKTGLLNNISSGIYFYTLRVGDSSSLRFSEFKKMILIK